MKKLLTILLCLGFVYGANARPMGHHHRAPHHHGHHHRGHLTTREEQKPVHKEKR